MLPYNVSYNQRRADFNYYKVLAPDGDFKKKYGFDREIDTLINVLTTRKGSYPGDPEFGSTLHLNLFEEADDITRINIEEEIKYIVDTYLKNTTLLSVEVLPYKDLQGFQVIIWLQYGKEKTKVPLSIYKGEVIAEF